MVGKGLCFVLLSLWFASTEACQPGYVGANCTNRCHCARNHTCFEGNGCVYGCQLGYTGFGCGLEQKRAEGLFYCFINPDGEEQMVLRVNRNNVGFRQMTAVDRGGNPISSCGRSAFNNTDGFGVSTITITKTGDNFAPDCGAETISEDTVTWRFTFKTYINMYTKYDASFEVTCKFSDADTLQVWSSHTNAGQGQVVLQQLEESHLNVVMTLTEPDSETPVTRATVGQALQLKVMYQRDKDYGVATIAPYSCEATTMDHSVSQVFLDENGCDVFNTPIHYLRRVSSIGENLTIFKSQEFEAFTFPGQDHVLFTCRIQICFEPNDRNCTNRCNNRFGLRNTEDRKQESPNTERVIGTVMTVKHGMI